uniref:RNA helicase n=1 Tax=Haptolina ericina TaxID=156174 RepID=A0A7S3AHJ0_9EUKA
MDSLLEEFPEAAEATAEKEESSDDDKPYDPEQHRAKKKELARVDHSTITYAAFRKHFYIEVPEIKAMSDAEVDEYKKSMDDIKVRGKKCPRPIKRWTQCGLSDRLLAVIEKRGYTKPFPIQAQALPAIMNGRDVIAIAKTGSGKTMGYCLPMLRHIMDQPPLANGEGPIGLILVPTRELAMQVYRETLQFTKMVGLSAVAVYGGANLKQQIAELKRGPEIVVCTPGRMIDMLTTNSGRVTNMKRVTYVVLDEADRMFDMGFAPQIDRIVGNCRPDRQTMLFSATFPSAVEKLARSVLHKPVQIVVGGISVVSNTIEQHVEVLAPEQKMGRLCEVLRHHMDEGQLLVFVDTQEACDNLFKELLKNSMPCATLHGGMGQDDRDSTISDFKSGNISLLVATSVAARGLDVKDLCLVVNYEVPNHYEDYVHRVGRTGRAGNTGTAYTFITPDEEKYAPDLVKAMEAAGQEPPDDVVCMANAYAAKRRAGELHSKDFRTSGFLTGTGIALDADAIAKQNKAKNEGRKRAMRAAGVETGDVEEEEDDNDGVTQKGGVTGPVDAVTSVAAAAAQAAKALQVQLGNAKGAAAAGAEVQKKLLADAKAASSGEGAAAAAAAAPVDPRKAALPEAVQRAMAAAAARAQEKAKEEANARLAAMKPLLPQRFTAELEINEYPQTARYKVMQRDSLQAIQEWTKVVITTKGAYYPPGRNPPPGERKLYMVIEGETEVAVKAAKKELRRTLEEHAAVAAPDDSSTNRYAKYSV